MSLRAVSLCTYLAILASVNLITCETASAQADTSESDLPPEAREALNAFEAESRDIRSNAEKRIATVREASIKQLDLLQNKYNELQKSDEAIAIREKIRQLRVAHLKSRPDPGNLVRYGHMVGQTFYFNVTGVANGSVWGTDVYTSDSNLASAAVHAGVLRVGQRGTVRVTIVKPPERFEGSERNGVMTFDFGPYPGSFKVRRPLATDQNTNESEPKPRTEPPQGDERIPF